MATSTTKARQALAGKAIWVWHYMHSDWQWEQSRHWHEERYAVSVREALDIMREDDEFVYFIDNISEFYQPVARRLGDRLNEFRQRVEEGRVQFASGQIANGRPTQVADETYIRNIQLGRAFLAERYPTADLSLFHSVDIAIGGVQMPQLLTQAGFEYYRAWRPHGPMNVLGIPHQFIWQGIDGSRILVTRGSYGMVWGPGTPPLEYEKDWDAALVWLEENLWHDQLIDDRSPSDQLWMIQGYDDARPMTTVRGDAPFDVLGFIAAWRQHEKTPIHWCTPLEYSRAVAEQDDKLNVVEGVLDGADVGYNMANHGANGLWVWRHMNDRRLVLAESLAAAAASTEYRPPCEKLRHLWWQHCTYQAHAQDTAFEDDWLYLIDRAKNVKYQAESIQAEALAAITQAAGGGERTTRLIVNPLPWPVETDVEIYHACVKAGVDSVTALDEQGTPLPQQQLEEFRHPRFAGSLNDERRLLRVSLPPLGYRRIELLESEDKEPGDPAQPEQSAVETSALRLTYRDHALREVCDLANGQIYHGRDGSAWPNLVFHVLDDQDWVFGGPELRRIPFAPDASRWLQAGPLRWHHRSYGSLGPYEACVDTIVADRGRELQVAVRLEGHWAEPPLTGYVTLLTEIDAGGQMTVDTPFAVEERDPDHDIYVDNVPQDQDYGIDAMFERLRPGIFWARSWADWSAADHGLTMISVDGCTYWLKEPHQFGHVVLRCLKRQLGTWEAFVSPTWSGSGVHRFRYALGFHDGQWRAADPQRRSLELRYPPMVARADHPSPPELPTSGYSFLRIDGPATFSAYYQEDDASILRFYESAGSGGTVTATLDWAPASAEVVDLSGRSVDTVARVEGNAVSVDVTPWQIVTLRLTRS